MQEGAAQAYDVSKQKASEAYASTAEYLKEKVGPIAAPYTLQSCRLHLHRLLVCHACSLLACLPTGMPASYVNVRSCPVRQCMPCKFCRMSSSHLLARQQVAQGVQVRVQTTNSRVPRALLCMLAQRASPSRYMASCFACAGRSWSVCADVACLACNAGKP